MLTEILSRETCAGCKICCTFDNYDIWETPVVSGELKEKILKLKPEQKFIHKDNSYLFRMEKADDQPLFLCPMLGEKGCILGNDKPFDCRIWPFRIMNLNGNRVITLSPVCPSIYKKPIGELVNFLNKGLAKQIFKEAAINPDIVKKYIEGYPILAVDVTP